MLPLCETWLRMISRDVATLKNELTVGNLHTNSGLQGKIT